MLSGCKDDTPEPLQLPKTLSAGVQSGTLTSGTAGTVTFTLTTAHIANGATGTVQWYANAEGTTTGAAPAGITASVSNVTNNTATVTVSAATTATAGTFWFKVTIDGTTSSVLTLTVDAQITYSISASTLASFGAQRTPYAQPAMQTVTITSTGTGAVTLTQPAAVNYEIGTLSATQLAAGATATFTVRPKASLPVGTYAETIQINGTNDAKATVSATFDVQAPFDGAGTSANPYKIGTAAQLKQLADLVNTGAKPYADAGICYQLTADIDLNIKPYNEGEGWTPIGTFRGIFDGINKTVSGLIIDGDQRLGLFGVMNGGIVKNLNLTDVNLTGNGYIGGIVGQVEAGAISNCSVSGIVKAITGYNTGGIAGAVKNGTIINCYTTCVVSGYDYVGGIIGFLHASDIESKCKITNCYTTGTVSGSGSVGGIAGGILYVDITNCYSTGEVSGRNAFIGGIVGYSYYCHINSCLALNPSITLNPGGIYQWYGRVAGYSDSDIIFSNNIAFSGMKAEGGFTFGSGAHDNRHGLSISAATAKTRSTYENAPRSWKFGANDDNPWKMGVGAYPLPVFHWQTTAPSANITHLN